MRFVDKLQTDAVHVHLRYLNELLPSNFHEVGSSIFSFFRRGSLYQVVIQSRSFGLHVWSCPALCLCVSSVLSGWLGCAMVLGSFQCRGVLLLLHIVGHGLAVLVAGVGRLGYIFFNIFLS